MAKPYRLMKVVEGQYNIRRGSDNGLVGNVHLQDGKWLANVFGKSAKLKTKEKALGFVRGAFALQSGSYSAHPEAPSHAATHSTGGDDYDSYNRHDALAAAVADIKDGLDALVEAVA